MNSNQTQQTLDENDEQKEDDEGDTEEIQFSVAPTFEKRKSLELTRKQIKINAFQTEVFDNLFCFKNENLFTDIFIYVDGVEFPCHKVVLCAASSYFRAMFSCDLKESRLGKVFIENISPWTMKRLLDFIYTGKIEINYENVIDVFNAAAMFQLYKLADKCTDYIEEHIDLTNCIEIEVFAAMHNLKKLEKDAFRFILENFMQLINSPSIPINLTTGCFNSSSTSNEEHQQQQTTASGGGAPQDMIVYFSDFVRLNEQTFSNLIKSDLLNVSREIYVYYALKKWTEYQMLRLNLNTSSNNSIKSKTKSAFAKVFENLFKHVRLHSLSREELEYILVNDKLVAANSYLTSQIKFILEAKTSISARNEPPVIVNNTSERNSEFCEFEKKVKSFNFSVYNKLNGDSNGLSEDEKKFDEKYLTKSNSATIRPSTIPREYICFMQLDQFFFYDFYKSKWDLLSSWPPSLDSDDCIGGTGAINKIFYENNSEHFPNATFKTTSATPRKGLNGFSTCLVNNILYVIGGCLKSSFESSEIESNGFTGFKVDLVDNVWRFDPIRNEWSHCMRMLRKRAFHVSISLTGSSNCSGSNKSSINSSMDSYIFLFYGICNSNNLSRNTSVSENVSESNILPHLLSNFSIRSGDSDMLQCFTIDFYNTRTDQWSALINSSNSLFNHHIFQSINNQNRTILSPTSETSNTSNLSLNILNQFIENQLIQSKQIVSLKSLIYVLKDNCIHCYEFNNKTEELNCLPYFRLPANLNSFILAAAMPVKSSLTSSSSLFSWYSDDEDSFSSLCSSANSSSSSSSSSIANLNKLKTSPVKPDNYNFCNNENINEQTEEPWEDSENSTDAICKPNLLKSKKEALIYLFNPQKSILYEFYPDKNKLKKLPNLNLKHSPNSTFFFDIKSKLYVTGGIVQTCDSIAAAMATQENCSVIEVFDQEKETWSIFSSNNSNNNIKNESPVSFITTSSSSSNGPLFNQSNNSTSVNNTLNDGIQVTKQYFKLKMSLV